MNIWDKYSEINLIKNKCSDIFIIVKGNVKIEYVKHDLVRINPIILKMQS